jgi:hypothetical protein
VDEQTEVTMLSGDMGVLVEPGTPEDVSASAPQGSTVSIKRAADIDGMFEVVGYGRVSEPSGAAQEMEIELFGRQIDAHGRVRGSGELERFSIGCGHLDDFTIGSWWLCGELQRSRRPEKIYTAQIGHSWIEHVGECRDDAQPDRPAPCFSYSGIREAPCVLMALDNGNAPAHHAAIPVLELARLVFGVSSRFLLQMFDGLRDPALVPDRALFDRRESERTSPTSIRLMCNREFSDEEALLAAMLVADPDLRAFHDGLFQSYMVGRRHGGPHAAYLRSPARFPCGTRITFNGRWVACIGNDGSAKRRFLITRILAIAIPASFRRVEMVYPSTTVDRELPPRDVPRNRRPRRPVEVETGVPPALGNDIEELTTHGGSVIIGVDVEVIRQPRCEGKRSPRRMVGYKDRDGPDSGSTSDRVPGGDSSVSPLALFRQQDGADEHSEASPPPAPQPLCDTFEALEQMCADKGWRLLPFGTGPFSLRRAWDATRGVTSVLVAMVATSTRHVLVIDPGTYAGDERSLGLLVPAHGRVGFDPAEVERILRQSARLGGRWGGRRLQARLRRHYVIRPVTRRTRAQQGPDLYGEQLGEAVLSLIR